MEVISSMHDRGLSFIGFNPTSIIVTSDNKFFCTGFTSLQKYRTHPGKNEDAYEVASLPKESQGDYARNYQYEISSYEKVWAPYFNS